MTQLLLHLLGPFQATLDDTLVTNFESDKARALLGYLAVEFAVAHPRSKLAGLFWPQWSESQARANLRHTLATLRTSIHDRNVSPPFLLISHQTIQANPAGNLWLDVDLFGTLCTETVSLEANGQAAKNVPKLEQAVSLYQGPFLDGFSLDGCAEFESWMLLTRSRLEQKILKTLQTLADWHLNQGNYQKAQGYARRQLEFDPLREDAYCQLMQILALMGERAAALTLYERCRLTLADELNVAPNPQTVQLHTQIQSGALAHHTSRPSTRSSQEELEHPPKPELRHNLPAPTTSFVGRTGEKKSLAALLLRQDIRLLTLHGPGGVGKTRLALEVARQIADDLDDFPDGIYWVDLVPLRSEEDVINALASVLGVRETASRTLEVAVKAYLRERHLLLLLDNFEHLLEVGSLVADLLAHAPALNILVTSREVLHLYGEHEVPVEPLAGTPKQPSGHLSEIAQSEAVTLFTQRAQAVCLGFKVNEDNAETIAKICWHLDGLPLALELAAAQLKYFTPDQLLAHLHEPQLWSKSLLKSTVQRPDRHKSLTTAIAWSYHLLSINEQHVFRCCAVFVGSFGLEALAAICSPSYKGDAQVNLFALVDKNLVRCVEASDPNAHTSELRFVLLETIREFGMVTLLNLDELEHVQSAHVNYYLRLAESLFNDTTTRRATQANDRLTLERDNIRAVMRWILDVHAPELGFRLANALWTFWTQRGGLREAYRWLSQLLDQAQDEPLSLDYAAALYVAGFSARHSGDLRQAHGYITRCLTMSRTLGDKEHIGLSLAMLSAHAFQQGNYAESRRLGQESLRLRREQGIEWQTAMILLNLGFRETKMGNFEAARGYLEEGLAYQRKIKVGDYGMAVALGWLGQLARWEGDHQGAKALLMESKQLCERSNLSSFYAFTCRELASLQIMANDYAGAEQLLVEALSTYDSLNDRNSIWGAFLVRIELYAVQEMYEEALRVAAFLTQFLDGFMVLPPVDRKQFDQAVALARKELTPQTAATAWAEGERMTLEEAVAVASPKERRDV